MQIKKLPTEPKLPSSGKLEQTWPQNDTPKECENCNKFLIHHNINEERMSPLAQIQLKKRKVWSLIDTGADKSVVSTKFLESLDKKDILKFEKSSHRCCGVTGHELRMAGSVVLKFKIGNTHIKHKFYVIGNIVKPVILGSDLLMGRKDLKVKIDCANRIMSIGNSVVILKNKEVIEQNYLVQVLEKTVIKPNSVNHIPSKISGNPKFKQCLVTAVDSEEVLFEQPGLLVANIVSKVRKNKKVPMVIVNQTDRTIVLKRGRTVGVAGNFNEAEVNSVAETNEEEVNTHISSEEKSDPLQGAKLDKLSPTEKEKVSSLLSRYGTLFAKSTKELGKTDMVKLSIETGDAKPIRQKPYRTPYSQRPVVEKEVQDMLEADIIRPSSSPWSSPIVVVGKKDGGNRFCVDYRKLNGVITHNSYPLPNIDDMLTRLGKAKYFTCLDLKSGYWQIEVNESDKPKTAFTCHMGLFEFNKMPFGIASAPSIFSALMDKVLMGAAAYAMCYIDDIIIFSETLDDHLKHLEDVLERLQKAGLKLKLSKCEFLMHEVKYLGHIISDKGISPDPEKTKVIETLNEPKSVKGVRSFIGMASYYRRFIKDFARIAKPLTQLTKKDVPFDWTNECTEAFQTLKNCLTNAPILAYPDPSLPYKLYTDASKEAVGAVLTQDQGGSERVIQYLSHQLGGTQKKWATIEQEGYAIVYSVNKLRHLLYGSKFTIHSDHKPLSTLFTSEMKNARVQRWAMMLSEYGGDIQYETGKTQKADLLSRVKYNPDDDAFDLDLIHELLEDVQIEVIDSDETQELGAPEFLGEGDEVVLEKGASLLQPGMSPLPQLQKEDETLKQVLKGVQEKDPKFKSFVLQDDILYHIALPVKHDPEYRLQLVLPESLRKEALIELHDHFGHMGIDKTHHLLRSRYYWTGMYKDVVEHLDSCDACRSRKIKVQKAPMQEAYIPQYPFECVGIDTVGPFPESEYGNSYIIVMVDHFSGWPEAFAVSHNNGETVAQLLFEEIIARHGCPTSITSDNGKEFCNNLIEKLTKNLNVHHIRTSPYHPEGNGKTERFNRFLKDALSKKVKDNHRDWDYHLSAVLMAYRMAVHDSTGFSPFFLVYGRDPILPMDTLLGPKIKYYGDNYIPQQLERLNKAFVEAKDNLEQVRAENKMRYDDKASDKKFTAGDAVFYRNHRIQKGTTKSLSPKWRPYYRVVTQTGPVTYVIRNQLTGKTGRVHANDLSLANADSAWNKVRVEHKPIDKTEDADTNDEGLQPTRKQPMRTCKLVNVTNEPVVTQHNKESKDDQPQQIAADAQSTSVGVRKRACSPSPSEESSKRQKTDDGDISMEIDVVSRERPVRSAFLKNCLTTMGTWFHSAASLL